MRISVSILIILAVFLQGCCGNREGQAIQFCHEHEGVKGYQDRYGFEVVVCNDGAKKRLE